MNSGNTARTPNRLTRNPEGIWANEYPMKKRLMTAPDSVFVMLNSFFTNGRTMPIFARSAATSV